MAAVKSAWVLACLPLLALSACSIEPVEGVVVSKKVVEEHTEPDTQCNGDPVLLICQDGEQVVPTYYVVTVAYPEDLERSGGGGKSKWAGEECHEEVTLREYEHIEVGAPVLLSGIGWNECEVEDWYLNLEPELDKTGE